MRGNVTQSCYVRLPALFVAVLSCIAAVPFSLAETLTSITDDNIRDAVNLWLKDPEAAMLQYGPIEQWNTTGIQDMSSLFYGAEKFNADLSFWDVSSVETMAYMFYEAFSFNGNVTGWQTQNIKDMAYAFWGASAFNQTLCWDVSAFFPPIVDEAFCGSGGSFDANCVDDDIIEAATICPTVPPSSAPTEKRMEPINDENIRDAMRLWLEDPAEATEIYGRIGDWKVTNVTDFSGLFEGAAEFNDDISGWQTSSAIKMDAMFRGAAAFNGKLTGFDLHQVISVRQMFDGAASFTGDGLEGWKTDKVQSFFAMFHLATSFDGNVGGWNVSSCVDFSYMFMGSAINRDLKWNVSSGTVFSWMFHKARAFNGDVTTLAPSRVSNLEGMFFGAEVFNQTICWNLPSGTVTTQMFCNSGGLAGLNSTCVGDKFIQESKRDCPMTTSAGAAPASTAVMLYVLTAVTMRLFLC